MSVETITRETTRKLAFLALVQQARADVIVAERHYIEAVHNATEGGCTTEEIAGARRLVDRAAGR